MTESEFEQVVLNCWNETLRKTKRKVSPSEEAEDLAAEIFARLWERREAISDGKGENYLRIMTKNSIADYHRRSRVGSFPIHNMIYLTQDKRRCDPLFLASLGEDTELLGRVMEGALTEMEKTVIHLNYGRGKMLIEISEILGTTPGSVKQTKRRALLKLRARMEGFGCCAPGRAAV